MSVKVLKIDLRGSLIICIATSTIWTVVYNFAGTHILNNSDVY